ncbi:MAG: hypothetical protein MJZ25_03285 [Fibrobacter sp.]|nr:hypothetical protein [Fibrobacter sp.]
MSETTENVGGQQENPVDVNKDSVNDILGQDTLMQSVLGKLYGILTTGDEVAPPSEDNFFAWTTPGYPIVPEDYEFAALGVSGETIDKEELKRRVTERIAEHEKNRLASGNESIEALDTNAVVAEIKDEMQKESQQRRVSSACDFASLVDFIPDVSGNSQSNLKTMYGEGSLSDVYESILTMSQVKKAELTEAEKAMCEKNRELLGEKVEEVVDILGEKTTKITPSPLMDAYNRYQDAYEEAVSTYHAQMIEGTLGDLKARQLWTMNGPTLRKRVNTASTNWTVSGYKNQVEKLSAQLAQIESRDFSILKEGYKQLLEHYKMSNANQEFLYTTFSPSNFVKSNGWTKFVFESKEVGTQSHADMKSHSRSITTKSGSIFHSHSTTNTEASSSHNMSSSLNALDFTLSFEFCQVKIVRPWFKESFLTSRYWRFDPKMERAGQVLSDGGNPPKGIMAAYPTSMLVVRNLTLKFKTTEMASAFSDSFKSKSAEYKGGVNIGCFNISAGAGYSNSDSSGNADSNSHFKQSGQEITIEGMQVIGFNCHVLGQSPNPNPEIGDEEWI